MTTLQGRDPHHILPGCQRGNNGLHTWAGHGFPRADHILAASPPMLPQHLYRAQKEGRHISTCNDTITRAPYPPFVKDPVGEGIGSKRGISVRHPLPPHVYITMGPSKVLNEPKCGSRALIPTHVCKNYIPKQLSARECVSRPPKAEHGGQRPCSVGIESVARISTRYPRGNSYPFRNTTAP